MIKRHKISLHITTWINIKDTMLSEKSQKQKTFYCGLYCITFLKTVKLYILKACQGLPDLGVGVGTYCKEA